MTTEDLMKRIKHYDVLVTGQAELDPATKTLVKDAEGKVKVKWMRDSNPSAELKAVGLGGGRFFQCEMIETNTVANTITLPDGTTADLGPLTSHGVPTNLFEAQQREPFNAIALKIIAGEFKVIKEAVGGDKPVNPVARITGYVQPGKAVEYDCGFDYYLHRRNAKTHKMEAILAWQYDTEGKLKQEKVIRHTGQLFLFGNELEAEQAHVATAINANKAFKVAPVAGVREKDADVQSAGEEPANITVPTI